MQDWRLFFKRKRVTVVGLGLLGRGLGDVRFLAEQGADIIVTDLKSAHDLAPSLEELKDFTNIRYTLGEHRLEDFEGRDLVINGPKVPADSPYLAHAREQKIPITMSTALFARFTRDMGATLVGVTGTRGKTTTTYLLAEMLKAAGKQVLIGGNVQGVSTLSLLPEVKKDTVAVLELDSWQLQGFREEKLSPEVAVFTTFYPDHLDYYGSASLTAGQAMDAYLDDKAQIFLYQKPEDTLVLGEQVEPIVKTKYAGKYRAQAVYASGKDIPKDWTLALPGEHNRGNAACALAAARALGVGDEVAREVLTTFRGVSGRLEFVRELSGVKFYNDTTATTPEATVAALQALDPVGKQASNGAGPANEKKIILIMGGADKGLDMSALRPAVHAHCKTVIFLAGTGTERIKSDAPDKPVFGTLKEALRAAVEAAEEGDIVLFSPAFASFGMFTNEYDRGEQFLRAVAELK